MKSTKTAGPSYHIGEIPLLRRVGVSGDKSAIRRLTVVALKQGFYLPPRGRTQSANQVSYTEVFLQCDVRHLIANRGGADTALWVIRVTLRAPVAHRE